MFTNGPLFKAAPLFVSNMPLFSSSALFGSTAAAVLGLIEPITVWIGNSITAGAFAFSIADWCNFFSMGRLNHDAIIGGVPQYNQGVTGNKTTDVIARLSAALASNPVFVELLIGTNDIGNAGRLAPAVIIDYQTIVNGILAWPSVQKLAVCTILSRSGANALNASQETQRQLVNTFIRTLPSTDSRIVLVDYDALSGWNPVTDSIDGLHPNNFGAFKLGKFNATQIAPIIAPTDVLANYTVGNLHPNPTLAGTGGGMVGGGTGVVANNCQVRDNTTGINPVNSKGTLGGYTSQDMALNGTSTANGNIQFRGVTTVNTVAGQFYKGMAAVKLSAGGNLSSLTMAFSGNNMLFTGTVAVPLNQDIEGVMRTGPIVISATQSNAAFDITASTLTGGVTNQLFQVSRPFLSQLP